MSMKQKGVYSEKDFEELPDKDKQVLLNILKENRDFVDQNKWNDFYKSQAYWLSDLYISTILTMMIYDLGIDPLKYMDSVPSFFLARADIDNFVIPEGVKSINSSAFGACENLKTITIPTTVEKIQEQSFEQCENLHKIVYKGTKDMWSQIDLASGWDEGTENLTIECSDGSYTKIKG